jgi:hypothetical protein
MSPPSPGPSPILHTGLTKGLRCPVLQVREQLGWMLCGPAKEIDSAEQICPAPNESRRPTSDSRGVSTVRYHRSFGDYSRLNDTPTRLTIAHSSS